MNCEWIIMDMEGLLRVSGLFYNKVIKLLKYLHKRTVTDCCNSIRTLLNIFTLPIFCACGLLICTVLQSARDYIELFHSWNTFFGEIFHLSALF